MEKDAAIVDRAFINIIQRHSNNTNARLNEFKETARALKAATKKQ